jgi:hypothetical protein
MAFGCSDATAPDASHSRSRSADAATPAIPAQQASAMQQVARGVALALDDAAVRIAVRDAMRDSPWNEHKLVFHEFLGTEGGTAVVNSAASALRMEPDQFLAEVAKLPSLDFYFPHGSQRRTWRGTPGIVVGATLASDGNETNYRFDSRGQAVPAPARSGPPGYPLVALIPAESKAVRQAPQPKGRGEVIEAANDGQRAESFRWIEPDGTVLTANMADIRAGRDPRFTIRMNTTSTGTTRIDCIKSTIRDGGVFAGNVELEIYAKFYGPNGAFLGTGEYKNHEFPEPDQGETVTRCPGAPLVVRVMPDQGTAKVNVELWEDDCDCWGNDDDYYGTRDIIWEDRAQFRDVGNDGNMLELDWNPIPPSVVSSVFVYPVTLYTGGTASAYAVSTDQYGYTLPTQPVSSWLSSNTSIAGVDGGGMVSGHATGSTNIHATIHGVTGSATATVEEDPYSECGGMVIC